MRKWARISGVALAALPDVFAAPAGGVMVLGALMWRLLHPQLRWTPTLAAPERKGDQPLQEPVDLRHPVGTLVFGLFTFAVFAALIVASTTAFVGTPFIWLVVPFFILALMCASTAISYFTDRHQATATELRFKPFFAERTTMRWRDVSSVRYVRRFRWFRVAGPPGKIARISIMLLGVPDFARLLLSGVPTSAISPDALPILQETAAGRPPSSW